MEGGAAGAERKGDGAPVFFGTGNDGIAGRTAGETAVGAAGTAGLFSVVAWRSGGLAAGGDGKAFAAVSTVGCAAGSRSSCLCPWRRWPLSRTLASMEGTWVWFLPVNPGRWRVKKLESFSRFLCDGDCGFGGRSGRYGGWLGWAGRPRRGDRHCWHWLGRGHRFPLVTGHQLDVAA